MKTITPTLVCSLITSPELDALSDADRAELQRELGRRLDRDFEKVFGAPPPPTGTITPKAPPCGCGPVFHRAGCRYGGGST